MGLPIFIRLAVVVSKSAKSREIPRQFELILFKVVLVTTTARHIRPSKKLGLQSILN